MSPSPLFRSRVLRGRLQATTTVEVASARKSASASGPTSYVDNSVVSTSSASAPATVQSPSQAAIADVTTLSTGAGRPHEDVAGFCHRCAELGGIGAPVDDLTCQVEVEAGSSHGSAELG